MAKKPKADPWQRVLKHVDPLMGEQELFICVPDLVENTTEHGLPKVCISWTLSVSPDPNEVPGESWSYWPFIQFSDGMKQQIFRRYQSTGRRKIGYLACDDGGISITLSDPGIGTKLEIAGKRLTAAAEIQITDAGAITPKMSEVEAEVSAAILAIITQEADKDPKLYQALKFLSPPSTIRQTGFSRDL